MAIAVTANFVNNFTTQESRVAEISGLAYIYNQEFFKELKQTFGIDLENIVYYKGDTHYFVMTPKKSCLLAKGVLRQVYLVWYFESNFVWFKYTGIHRSWYVEFHLFWGKNIYVKLTRIARLAKDTKLINKFRFNWQSSQLQDILLLVQNLTQP